MPNRVLWAVRRDVLVKRKEFQSSMDQAAICNMMRQENLARATAAVVALILGFLTHRGYRIPQLASLALVSCAVLALVGMQLRSRYLAAMRRRVARRSVARSSTTFIAVWKSTSELGYHIASMAWGARSLMSTQVHRRQGAVTS